MRTATLARRYSYCAPSTLAPVLTANLLNPAPPSLTPATPSLIWTQLLDSRPAPPTPASPGAFEILSTTDVRESGEMFNPLTNKNEAYEEVWRRLRFAPSDYVIMERVDRAYNAERKREAGATAEEEAHTLPRAFIARLGPWAIGMGRDSKGAFSAYREELEAGRGWVRKYTVGSMLPTLRVLPRLIVGERMRLEVGEWVVRVVGRAGSA